MKTLIKSLIIASILILFSTYAFAANTTVVTNQNQVITITGLDEDWDASTETETMGLLRNGVLKICAIVFYPSATNDEMIIRDDSATGGFVFDLGIYADAYDAKVLYFNEPIEANPYIYITECVLGTAANAKVMIYILKPKP